MIRSSKSSALASRSRAGRSRTPRRASARQGPRRRPAAVLGVDQLVLQVGDLGGEPAGRVALGVEVQLAADQLHQPLGVGGVVDREGRLEAERARARPAGCARRRSGTSSPTSPGPVADERGHALPHLAGGLVGEGDRQDLARMHLPRGQQVGDAVGEHPGLARAGPGHDQQRRPGGRPPRAARRSGRPAARAGSAPGPPVGRDGVAGTAGTSKSACIAPRVYAGPPTTCPVRPAHTSTGCKQGPPTCSERPIGDPCLHPHAVRAR